jgi:hypothetical protein
MDDGPLVTQEDVSYLGRGSPELAAQVDEVDATVGQFRCMRVSRPTASSLKTSA